MVITSNIDAILGICLYYKVFIVVLIFKFNWHLVLSFEKSENSTQPQGSLCGQISVVHTHHSPAAAGEKRGQSSRPETWPHCQRDFSLASTPQQGLLGTQVRLCVAGLPSGRRMKEGAPAGPASQDLIALHLLPRSLQPFF